MMAAITAAAAMLLALSGSADGGANWSRTFAPNGAFSIETPCDASAILLGRSVPNAELPIRNYVPESRVLCRIGERAFMAGVVEMNDVPNGITAFDYLVQALARRHAAQGRPLETTVAGRRAVINRASAGGVVAQTGFIEIGPKRVITLVAGSRAGDVNSEPMAVAIERFYGSIEVRN